MQCVRAYVSKSDVIDVNGCVPLHMNNEHLNRHEKQNKNTHILWFKRIYFSQHSINNDWNSVTILPLLVCYNSFLARGNLLLPALHWRVVHVVNTLHMIWPLQFWAATSLVVFGDARVWKRPSKRKKKSDLLIFIFFPLNTEKKIKLNILHSAAKAKVLPPSRVPRAFDSIVLPAIWP